MTYRLTKTNNYSLITFFLPTLVPISFSVFSELVLKIRILPSTWFNKYLLNKLTYKIKVEFVMFWLYIIPVLLFPLAFSPHFRETVLNVALVRGNAYFPRGSKIGQILFHSHETRVSR